MLFSTILPSSCIAVGLSPSAPLVVRLTASPCPTPGIHLRFDADLSFRETVRVVLTAIALNSHCLPIANLQQWQRLLGLLCGTHGMKVGRGHMP